MSLNVDLPISPENSHGRWLRAKNIILDRDNKTPISEGEYDVYISLPNENICGRIVTPDAVVLYTTRLSVGYIYRVVNGVLTLIVKSSRFPFSPNNPITGTYTRNSKNDLIVSWTDGVTEACILNLDNLPFSVDPTTKAIVGETDDLYSLVNVFPYVKTPHFETSIGRNGNLPKGTYWFFIAYGFDDGTFISWSSLSSKPVYIQTLHYSQDAGNMWIGVSQTQAELEAVINANTTKSIDVVITNVDSKFTSYKIGVLYMNMGGVLRGFETEERTLIPTNTEIRHNHVDNKNEIGHTEIISDYLQFRGCAGVSNYQGDLIFANIFNYQTTNIQKYVNNWELWQTYQDITPSFGVTDYYEYSKTFMPGDVYSFNAHLITHRGFVTDGYRIPFNPDPSDLTATWNDDIVGGCLAGEKEFKAMTTAAVGAGRFFNVWQNENEIYSSDENSEIWNATGQIGTLTGNTKYHKFAYPDEYDGGSTSWRRLGIQIKKVYLPPNIASNYQGYFISHVLRDPTIKYGNIRADVLNNIYFFDVDAIANKPMVGGFLRVMMPFQTGTIHDNISDMQFYTNRDSYYYYDSLSGTYKTDYFTINDFKYLPANNDIVDNELREERLRLHVDSIDLDVFNMSSLSLQLGQVQTIPDDLYLDKTKLSSRCTRMYPINYTEGIDEFEGDAFLGIELFDTATHPDKDTPSANYTFGFVNYSNINAGFDIPITIITDSWFNTPPVGGTPTVLSHYYNFCFNKGNSVKPLFQTNVRVPPDYVSEHLVVRSKNSPSESVIVNWRLFPIDKSYNVDNATGNIVEIITNKDKLYIFTTNEVLIATLHDTLNTVNQSLRTVQSQLFDYPPEVIMDGTTGVAGLYHKCHATSYTGGVIWFSLTSGKMFQLTGELEELTGKGIESLIQTLLNSYVVGTTNRLKEYSNPYTGGFSLVVDEERRRLLFNINKAPDTIQLYPTILSYNLFSKEWICAHDYNTLEFAYNKDGLILIGGSFDRTKLYKYNPFKTTSLDSYIDVLFSMTNIGSVLYEAILIKPEIVKFSDINMANPVNSIKSISLYNSHQFSGEITLTPKSTIVDAAGNYDNVEGVIIFQKFADVLKDNEVTFIKNDWTFDTSAIHAELTTSPVETYSTYKVITTSATQSVTYNNIVYSVNGQLLRTTHNTAATFTGGAKLLKIGGSIAKRSFNSPYIVVRIKWKDTTTIVKIVDYKVITNYDKASKEKA